MEAQNETHVKVVFNINIKISHVVKLVEVINQNVLNFRREFGYPFGKAVLVAMPAYLYKALMDYNSNCFEFKGSERFGNDFRFKFDTKVVIGYENKIVMFTGYDITLAPEYWEINIVTFEVKRVFNKTEEVLKALKKD